MLLVKREDTIHAILESDAKSGDLVVAKVDHASDEGDTSCRIVNAVNACLDALEEYNRKNALKPQEILKQPMFNPAPPPADPWIPDPWGGTPFKQFPPNVYPTTSPWVGTDSKPAYTECESPKSDTPTVTKTVKVSDK